MAQLKAFTGTDVSLAKTQESMRKLMREHGVKASRWTDYDEGQTDSEPGRIVFEFAWQPEGKAMLEFRISVEFKSERGPRGGKGGTTAEQAARAIFWHVKNLFDSVSYGIVTLEEAFYAHMLTNNGETVYERTAPQIAAIAAGQMPRVFPALEDRSARS